MLQGGLPSVAKTLRAPHRGHVGRGVAANHFAEQMPHA